MATPMSVRASLPRLRPDPLPAIHPEPEYRASGRRAAWYEDVKNTLQVPWMGVVTMAYAHYPNFFAELWRGLQPLAASVPFVQASRELREIAEARAVGLGPAPIERRLHALGYAPRELGQIRATIEVFSHGNFPYLLIATLARLLLEGGEARGAAQAERFTGRHAPADEVPLVLMEAHHADAPTRAVYEDIKATLGLPFVNTDYRAFARWPSWFALGWSEIRPLVQSAGHEAACQAVHEQALRMVSTVLPNPGALSGQALRAAAAADAPLEEIVQVARLFQWLLPGLVVNVALLRAQLAG
jgi:hypothetical protein